MENIPKSSDLLEIDDAAKRQYIDSISVFRAWEEASKAVGEVRGGMYWKRTGQTEYLIRTSPSNSQKSLGPKSAETEAIHKNFFARKSALEQRVTDLRERVQMSQRLNRALHVGRVPVIVVDILNMLAAHGISDYFTVVGTHALYAYESTAGVRIVDSSAMETQDIDLLWDARKRLQFMGDMKLLSSSMVGLLQKVDPTFVVRSDQQYTATNSKGFEVDILRREVEEGLLNVVFASEAKQSMVPSGVFDRHGLRPRDDGDGYFSSVIVSTTGRMARMNTISPVVFCQFKRWLAEQPDRDPLKRSRDRRQADVVDALIDEYLPQLRSTAKF